MLVRLQVCLRLRLNRSRNASNVQLKEFARASHRVDVSWRCGDCAERIFNRERSFFPVLYILCLLCFEHTQYTSAVVLEAVAHNVGILDDQAHNGVLVDNFDHVVLQLGHVLRLRGCGSQGLTHDEGFLQSFVGSLLPLLDVLVNQDRVLVELINVAFLGLREFTFPLLNILLVLCDFSFALTFDCLGELGIFSILSRLHHFFHLIDLLPSFVYAHLVFLGPIKQVFRLDASLVQFAKLEDLLSQLVSRFCDNFVYFFCLLVPQ